MIKNHNFFRLQILFPLFLFCYFKITKIFLFTNSTLLKIFLVICLSFCIHCFVFTSWAFYFALCISLHVLHISSFICIMYTIHRFSIFLFWIRLLFYSEVFYLISFNTLFQFILPKLSFLSLHPLITFSLCSFLLPFLHSAQYPFWQFLFCHFSYVLCPSYCSFSFVCLPTSSLFSLCYFSTC